MKSHRQSPIFVCTYDFLIWLIPRLLAFPRSQRGVLARQLRIQAFALHGALVDAATCPGEDGPLPKLRRADAELTKLRTYVRLSYELELFSSGQYEHAARMLNEIGRLLGGWIKKAANDV